MSNELEYKLLKILPSDKTCTACDGVGGWTETDHFKTVPRITWIVCDKCGGKPDKETFEAVKQLISQAEEAAREDERGKIVVGLQNDIKELESLVPLSIGNKVAIAQIGIIIEELESKE